MISQILIIIATIVTLAIAHGICMIMNVKPKIYSSHEHMPIYIDKVDVYVAKIHFFVLTVPIVMLGGFAAVNVAKQYPRETIIKYTRSTVVVTLIAAFIGMIVQTIVIIKNNKKDNDNLA